MWCWHGRHEVCLSREPEPTYQHLNSKWRARPLYSLPQTSLYCSACLVLQSFQIWRFTLIPQEHNWRAGCLSVSVSTSAICNKISLWGVTKGFSLIVHDSGSATGVGGDAAKERTPDGVAESFSPYSPNLGLRRIGDSITVGFGF